MKAILAALLATTALGAAGVALADGMPEEVETFTWIEPEEDAAAPVPASDPVHPALGDYPTADAPKMGVPKGGEPRYMNLRGEISPDAPPAMLSGAGVEPKHVEAGQAQPKRAEPKHAPAATDDTHWPTYREPHPASEKQHRGRTDAQRRGETVGDDGLLETIQDQPAHHIHRRGGETPGSRAGYTHPDDIRRANSLEERRIPIHEVGRYVGHQSPLWHADPQNPWQEPAGAWEVIQGEMLSTLLTRWGDQAGYTIVWELAHDYVLRANVILKGTFPEAVGKVVESFANANPPVHAEFFVSNRVVVISTAVDFDGR